MTVSKLFGIVILAGIIGLCGLELGARLSMSGGYSFVSNAEARVGRPLTPVSVAGVALIPCRSFRSTFLAFVGFLKPKSSHGPQYSIQIRDWKTGDEVASDDFGFKNSTNAKKVDLKDLQGMSELPKHFKRGGAQ